jgi:hypothetical protein
MEDLSAHGLAVLEIKDLLSVTKAPDAGDLEAFLFTERTKQCLTLAHDLFSTTYDSLATRPPPQ